MISIMKPLFQIINLGFEPVQVGVGAVEQLNLEWEWGQSGRGWLQVQVTNFRYSSKIEQKKSFYFTSNGWNGMRFCLKNVTDRKDKKYTNKDNKSINLMHSKTPRLVRIEF